MGNYITKQDILEQLPEESLTQLTDDEGIGSVNDTRVDAAIEDAEGEADGYLAVRYTTPLSPVPAIIKKFAVDIAVYNLFARRDVVPEMREKRYDNAIKFLSNVSKGVVLLGDDAPAETGTGNTIEFKNQDRVFSRDNLKGF